jgi:hypothetical protein
VRTRSDTRIKPEEVRPIEVMFRNIKSSRQLLLRARLFYQYNTEMLRKKDGREVIEPVEMKFLLASAQNTVKPPRR